MDLLNHARTWWAEVTVASGIILALIRYFRPSKMLYYVSILWDRARLVETANEWMQQAEMERKWGRHWRDVADRCQNELDRCAGSPTREDAPPASDEESN